MADPPPTAKHTTTDASVILLRIARLIVDNPDALKLEVILDKRKPVFILIAPDVDVGKLIGRNARMAEALRTLVDALTARQKLRITLRIQPSGEPSRVGSIGVMNQPPDVKGPTTSPVGN